MPLRLNAFVIASPQGVAIQCHCRARPDNLNLKKDSRVKPGNDKRILCPIPVQFVNQKKN